MAKTKVFRKKSSKSWTKKRKMSINCKKPKGFSQKQYCKYGRKKNKTIKNKGGKPGDITLESITDGYRKFKNSFKEGYKSTAAWLDPSKAKISTAHLQAKK